MPLGSFGLFLETALTASDFDVKNSVVATLLRVNG